MSGRKALGFSTEKMNKVFAEQQAIREAEEAAEIARISARKREYEEHFRFVPLTNNGSGELPTLDASDTTFSYDNLVSETTIEKDRYHTDSGREDGFITLALDGLKDKDKDNKTVPMHGLKIEISLDDTIPGNIKRGWDAIENILRYYRVGRSKVMDVTRDDYEKIKDDPVNSPFKCGKQIVIYANVHPENSDWGNVLRAITAALLREGVEQGYRPHKNSSNAIKENCYLSYRADCLEAYSIADKYRAANSTGAFPEGMPDILAHLTIPTPGRLPKLVPTNKQKPEPSASTATSEGSASSQPEEHSPRHDY